MNAIDTFLYAGFYLFAGLAIVLGLLIALRQLTLWYFRINDIVRLLEEQNELLRQRTNVSKPIISRTDVPFGQSQNR